MDDWLPLDSWWDTYVATTSPASVESDTLMLVSRCLEDIPEETGSWWELFAASESWNDEETIVLGGHAIDDLWTDLDPWWMAYIRVREDDVSELQKTLNESDELWEHQGGYLDADPLSTDWAQDMRAGDPLYPGVEEDWSDWLAQLLRSDDGRFHRELFGNDIGASRSVEREDYLSGARDTDRYADIVITTHTDGISVEVKIGDTEYEKTIDTVELIEEQYYQEWNHYLLLPEWNMSALRSMIEIDDDRDEDESQKAENDEQASPTIPNESTEEIEILYWSDVSRALRTVLLDNTEQQPHWAASAYLFCTQIEQEILGFTPKPAIDRLAVGADTAAAFESVSVAVGDLESQTTYLKEFTKDNTNE